MRRVSGDGKFAFLVVNDRAQSRTAQVPRFVSESAFTEEIKARTKVGDAQDRRRLAVLNLETGEACGPGSTASAIRSRFRSRRLATSRGRRAKPDPAPKRDVRWGNADAVARRPHRGGRRCAPADNTERWLAAIDPATGTDEGPRSHQGRGVGA